MVIPNRLWLDNSNLIETSHSTHNCIHTFAALNVHCFHATYLFLNKVIQVIVIKENNTSTVYQ